MRAPWQDSGNGGPPRRQPASPAGRTTVLLADDYIIVREGVRLLLDRQADMSVVGEADTGSQAVLLASRLLPTVIVTEILLLGVSGIELAARMSTVLPSVSVVALTASADERYVVEMLRARASGYVLKRSSPADLVYAIRSARNGAVYLDRAISRSVVSDYIRRFAEAERRRLDTLLTERELQVLQLVIHGLSTQEIASRLSISAATVQTHVSHILDRLGVGDRIALAAYAARNPLPQAAVDAHGRSIPLTSINPPTG